MKIANIDVTKLEKDEFHKGAQGTYTDLLFFDNRDGVDKYGNSGFIVQGISKERRDAGERGNIVGNFKYTENQKPVGEAPQQAQPAGNVEGDDDIPF